MKFTLGHSEYHAKQLSEQVVVEYAPGNLINDHLLICGQSGVGKSHQMRRFICFAAQNNIRVNVFDVHHDLAIPGSSSVLFSEQSRVGFNPLELNPNPHSGGVRKKINAFVKLINSTGLKLGTRQESVLRNLLTDVYYLNGIKLDNPNTWQRQRITQEQRNDIISRRAYNELRHFYPTLPDVISLCERKLKMLYVGADSKAISALEEVNKLATKLQKLNRSSQNAGYDDHLDAQFEKVQDKAIESYMTYVNSISTGRELNDLIKYNSKDTLQSVLERLQRLDACGIFTPNPPMFGNSLVRNYQVKHLSMDERKMLIFTKAEEIFRRALDAGETHRLREVIVIDEASNFMDDEKDNILNIIAKEARKFGLGLWCSAQSPKGFSEDFLTTVGTTMLLPIHTAFWDLAKRKLKINEKVLRFCKARKVAAVKMDVIGDSSARYNNVLLPQQ